MIYFLSPFWSGLEWGNVIRLLFADPPGEVPKVLEGELKRLTGASYALALNLGRSCIQVTLEAYNFPKGSEVILPSFSCSGVVTPVIQAGLTPVYADIDQDFNLVAESVRSLVSGRTCAIIFPHLCGKFAKDTFEILSLAEKADIKTIEDATQAFGLMYKNKWAGTFGDVGIFSFGNGKNMFGTGGGAIITDDQEVALYCQNLKLVEENPRIVRNRIFNYVFRYSLQSLSSPFLLLRILALQLTKATPKKISFADFKFSIYRISKAEALLAIQNIKNQKQIISKRKSNANDLLQAKGFEKNKLQIPNPDNHVFTKFLTSTVSDRNHALLLRHKLRAQGIETESSYLPLHIRKPFDIFSREPLPTTELLSPGAFSIPVRPNLTNKQMQRIVEALNSL